MTNPCEKYEWWNTTGIDRASKWTKDATAELTRYVRNLSKLPPTQEGRASLKLAVDSLTEALFAAKLAQKKYGKTKHLQAAE